MNRKYFLIYSLLSLFFICSCGSKQYGVATYNYEQNKVARKMEKVGAHGSKNRISQGDERRRIKYYNNPEYKRKLLEKRRKKKGKSNIDGAKSQG